MQKYKLTFDSFEAARRAFCGEHDFCSHCPMTSVKGNSYCNVFCNSHPQEAMECMGIEVVEVKDSPRLTAAELMICRSVGAKYISRDEENYNHVDLWIIKPRLAFSIPRKYIAMDLHNPKQYSIASVDISLFPSVSPGCCISVEDALESAK